MSIFKNPMVLYSIGHRLLLNNHKLLAKIISLFKRLIFSCNDIPITAEIGEGTQFPHRGIGVIIHGNAKIGKGCKIETNVVIGGRNGRGAPTIGDYCF